MTATSLVGKSIQLQSNLDYIRTLEHSKVQGQSTKDEATFRVYVTLLIWKQFLPIHSTLQN